MSLHIMFGALIFWILVLGMTKRELLMQPRYAKITTLEIDTCLTWRGMNSPALAALDDASKMPFKAPFQ